MHGSMRLSFRCMTVRVLKALQIGGEASDWATVDAAVSNADCKSEGRKVLLTNTVLSPSLLRAIAT